MNCRVCNSIVSDGSYCSYCGWLCGEVEITGLKLNATYSEISYSSFGIRNKYVYADVEAKFKIIDPIGLVFFVDEDRGNKLTAQFSKKICAGKTDKIKIAFDFKNNKDFSGDELMFVVEIETDDNCPVIDSTLPEFRPYQQTFNRTERYTFRTEILKPSELVINKMLLVFNEDIKAQELYLKNNGKTEIFLSKSDFKVDKKFKICFDSDEFTIKPDEQVSITIMAVDTNIDSEYNGDLKILQQAGTAKIEKTVKLFIGKQEMDMPDELYEYIVAVDFGTSKTTVAFIDLLKAMGGGVYNPQIELVELGVNKYEMPSCIAYNKDGSMIIGNDAFGLKDLADYTDKIKMHLRNDQITFYNRLKKEEKKRSTTDTITAFLRKLREMLPSKIASRENLFVFTLPVLDNDTTGENYKKQESVTVTCAKEAGFGKNIITLSEPEAAMYYVINAIKTAQNGWEGVNLQNQDKICVFDYGAGTLDISFGQYKLEETIPSIYTVARIGMFGDTSTPNAKRFYLGGDRIDNRILTKICEKYANPEDEDNYYLMLASGKTEYENDEKTIITEAEIDSESPKYSEEPWRVLKEIAKNRKEFLSRKITDTESIAFDESETYETIKLERETLFEIISSDMNYVTAAMYETIKKYKLEELKYIFMVGGTSLFKKVKEILERAFPSIPVISPYEYGGDSDETQHNEAILAIAKGAAVSYITRVTKTLYFDMVVRPRNNTRLTYEFEKGKSIFSFKSKPIYGKVAAGAWEIAIRLENGEYIEIGNFNINCGAVDFVSLYISFDSTRKFDVSYEMASTGKFMPLDLNIYV